MEPYSYAAFTAEHWKKHLPLIQEVLPYYIINSLLYYAVRRYVALHVTWLLLLNNMDILLKCVRHAFLLQHAVM